MRTPLVVVLFFYGISHGLGFVQPSTAALLQRRRSNRCLLFTPGDDKGPIVTTASKPKRAAGRKVAREPGGGWGSWEKVVSQRVEQDSVLEKLQPPAGLQVRTITKGDMVGVSRSACKWLHVYDPELGVVSRLYVLCPSVTAYVSLGETGNSPDVRSKSGVIGIRASFLISLQGTAVVVVPVLPTTAVVQQ